MQQIACFTGTVPEIFFGNIQYHMELKQPYKSLHLIIDYADNKDSAGAPSKTLTQSIRNDMHRDSRPITNRSSRLRLSL